MNPLLMVLPSTAKSGLPDRVMGPVIEAAARLERARLLPDVGLDCGLGAGRSGGRKLGYR